MQEPARRTAPAPKDREGVTARGGAAKTGAGRRPAAPDAAEPGGGPPSAGTDEAAAGPEHDGAADAGPGRASPPAAGDGAPAAAADAEAAGASADQAAAEDATDGGGGASPAPAAVLPAASPPEAEVAAAEAVDVAPAGVAAAALTFAEACAALSVTPYVLRRVMDEYEEVLPPLVEAGAERRVPAAALSALGAVVAWRNAGLGAGAIRERLRASSAAPDGAPASGGPVAGDPPAGTAGAPTLDRLVGEVAALQEQLQRNEQRQAEDRDRLLTALMRTNQELQHLRHEMAVRSRRDRRRGLWGRLFG